ncbi:hypothetical protein FB45DRAFT_373267 [Roridomyces roridus]|uniref:Uncharacterized protein n=1 Tax=Roridomyces roridus TaxID=1738132 RepID=A0AAD7B3J4_9AGAR|nr:hypothetical protein FB45DRAFT_373267 [Roridomyces roridus]
MVSLLHRSTIHDRLPLLRKVGLRCNDIDTRSIHSVDCFGNPPCLTDAVIIRGRTPLSFNVTGSRLTHLSARVGAQRLCDILRASPTLVVANLNIDPGPESDIKLRRDSKCILPRLQRLSVSAPCLLKYLEAPSLKQLSFVVTRSEVWSLIGEPHRRASRAVHCFRTALPKARNHRLLRRIGRGQGTSSKISLHQGARRHLP